MKRRKFISRSIGAGMIAGSAITLGNLNQLFAAKKSYPVNSYDLVAIKGGEPGEMFDKGIKSLGGMTSFIKKNQTVVVKPNIGWDVLPERAANTNPKLIYRIIEHCFNAGAKDVYVFDNSLNKWDRCYKNSGIEKAVKDAGGTMVPGNIEGYYHEVEIPKGKRLKSTKVHELILESNVFINVPVLKNHNSTRLSSALKNLMGIIWDRQYWHRNDLHQCIADFATYCKPDLNVVDAYNVIKKNGPRGVSIADVVKMKSQVISTNMVTVDTAAAKIFGMEPEDIPYINHADEMNIGSKDLTKLLIHRIKI